MKKMAIHVPIPIEIVSHRPIPTAIETTALILQKNSARWKVQSRSSKNPIEIENTILVLKNLSLSKKGKFPLVLNKGRSANMSKAFFEHIRCDAKQSNEGILSNSRTFIA